MASAALDTNSALLLARLSRSRRILFTSPVRTPSPPRASTHTMTRAWFAPMPAAVSTGVATFVRDTALDPARTDPMSDDKS